MHYFTKVLYINRLEKKKSKPVEKICKFNRGHTVQLSSKVTVEMLTNVSQTHSGCVLDAERGEWSAAKPCVQAYHS